MFKVVEKGNILAVHGIFDYKDNAERHIKEAIPYFIKRGYFTDKTLTENSFKIIEVTK